MNADARLDAQGAVHFTGADAVTFLQGQLTADVAQLEPGVGRLAACNTPQGRVIALLRLVPHAGGILALLPRALAQPLADRLRRYVLRAKVQVRVADELAFAGCLANAIVRSDAPAVVIAAGGALVALGTRTLVLAPRDALANVVAALGAPLLDDARWRAAGIAAGDPEVEADASEEWIPQMLNLDLLDGISFRKGCYTGQEIVARTQHLGRIKRRTFRFGTRGDVPPPKAPLLLDGTKVGEVVMAARVDDHVELLAVVGLEARDRELVRDDGTECAPLPLPYAVP